MKPYTALCRIFQEIGVDHENDGLAAFKKPGDQVQIRILDTHGASVTAVGTSI